MDSLGAHYSNVCNLTLAENMGGDRVAAAQCVVSLDPRECTLPLAIKRENSPKPTRVARGILLLAAVAIPGSSLLLMTCLLFQTAMGGSPQAVLTLQLAMHQ